MVEIQLANGRGVALVDDADEELVRRYKWCLTRSKHDNTAYAKAWVYQPRKQCVLLHRLIVPGAERVDHINRDGLDNRRSNLRACTHAQNMSNSAPYNGRKYKGIRAYGQRWQAQLQQGGRNYYLGTFNTEEDAARAYDAAALHHFGEFARLNFPVAVAPTQQAPLAA